ncbi:MAG TPA: SRPBCC domain-containing protein [Bryobacteraceae bacterium]|jgi:uncharacterized protein YndB with AHSA1/START domain
MRLPILFLITAAAQAAQPSSVTVVKQSDPVKALIFEVLIPAPRADVWRAFTTSDGLSTWLTPGAITELRPGGEWTAHFPGGKTGGGTILSFIPEEEVVMSAMAPEKFPTVRAERTTAKFQFESKGDSSTLVRLTQTGWKSGKEWDDAYAYLASGNAQLLETLKRRFVDGPLDWNKEWGPGTVK